MKLEEIKKKYKLKAMTPKEVKEYCDNLLDQYGVPEEIRRRKISDEEFQKIMNKLTDNGKNPLSEEINKMRREDKK